MPPIYGNVTIKDLKLMVHSNLQLEELKLRTKIDDNVFDSCFATMTTLRRVTYDGIPPTTSISNWKKYKIFPIKFD